MKKIFKSYFLVWLILCIAFNAACFLTPNQVDVTDKLPEEVEAIVLPTEDGVEDTEDTRIILDKFGGAFWGAYAGIMVAFVGQLIVAFFAFRAKTPDKFFLNVPLIRISYSALILTLIFGTACMIIPNLPNWVGAAVCLVILLFKAIALVKASTAAAMVERRGQEVKAQTLFIKMLTADADGVVLAASPETKAEAKKVYEAIRYSDPMSNSALSDVESQITIRFAAFSEAVKANDAETVKTVSAELLALIADRNRKCKMLK